MIQLFVLLKLLIILIKLNKKNNKINKKLFKDYYIIKSDILFIYLLY
jgi:hypothetical protein